MWEPQGFYSSFLLKQPTVFFGEAAIRGLFNYPGAKYAIIYGSGFDEAKKELFSKSLKGFEVAFFQKSWKGEPVLEELQGTILQLEQFKPDVIIAIGGGSVIDGAKVARLFYEFPFFDVTRQNFNFVEFKTSFVAVPTTVGSGAEASSAAVLLNRQEKKKEMVVSHSLQPSIVILMPELISSSSERLVISSAIDAMAHIIEGYVSNIQNSMAEILGEQGLAIFARELNKHHDIDYLRLQYAGYLGGIVQNHCIVGAAHAIAHQLAGYGYGHSEAVAIMLPAVIKQNSKKESIADLYKRLAQNSGLGSIDDIISILCNLSKKVVTDDRIIETKKLLSELINDEHFIQNVIDDKGGKGNPIDITKEYITDLIKNL